MFVHPDFQRTGTGRRLAASLFKTVPTRQQVLITDDEPRQRAFYDSWCLSAVNIAGSAGLLIGSAIITITAARLRRDKLIICGMVGGAIFGGIVLAFSPAIPFVILAYLLKNLFVQLTNAPLTAIFQEHTPLGNSRFSFRKQMYNRPGPLPSSGINWWSFCVCNRQPLPTTAYRSLDALICNWGAGIADYILAI